MKCYIYRRSRRPLGVKIIKMANGLDDPAGYFPDSGLYIFSVALSMIAEATDLIRTICVRLRDKKLSWYFSLFIFYAVICLLVSATRWYNLEIVTYKGYDLFGWFLFILKSWELTVFFGCISCGYERKLSNEKLMQKLGFVDKVPIE